MDFIYKYMFYYITIKPQLNRLNQRIFKGVYCLIQYSGRCSELAYNNNNNNRKNLH